MTMTIPIEPVDVVDVGSERPEGSQAGDALVEALSNLKVAQSGEASGQGGVDLMSSQEGVTNKDRQSALRRGGDATGSNNDPLVVDPVLVDAMRNARDKAFVLQQEKEMEARIRDKSIVHWDVPLMNSYQKLLVHRIAEYFRLGHSLDPVTRQVTLTKNGDTRLPVECISTLASNERLSEPASIAFPPLVSSLSGQNTPSSADTTPGAPFGVRIMRRPGAGTSRSDSPRNGSATPDEAGGSGARRDRRNRTLEEREAEYKEARLRIFGDESTAAASSVDGPASSSTSLPLNEAGSSSSKENRPLLIEDCHRANGSRADPSPPPHANGDTPSESQRSLHRSDSSSASSQSDSHQATYGYYASPSPGYEVQMFNGRMPYATFPYSGPDPAHQVPGPYFVSSAGQWTNAPMPFQPPIDAHGRPMVPGSWMYVGYPPYAVGSASSMLGYSDHSPSPGASSRSTSLSAGTEGGRDSRHSSIGDQNLSNAQAQQPHQHVFANSPSAANFPAPPMPATRSQSVSPSAPFQARRTPPGSGNVTPNSMGMNGSASAWTPYHYPPSHQTFLGVEHSNGVRPINGQVPNRLASGTPPGGVMHNGGAFFPVGRSEENVLRTPRGGSGAGVGATGTGRGRGRASQGSDRSLYDPNKPTQTAGTSSAASSSSVVSPGTSTGGRSTDTQGAKRDNSVPSMPQFNRSVSSGAESQTTRSTSSASTGSRGMASGESKVQSPMAPSPSITRQMHSLPPRPDWAVRAGRSSSSSGSSVSNSVAYVKPSAAVSPTSDTSTMADEKENSA